MCSCSQTAARRSRDSALCAAPHVLVLAKKVWENADVLALRAALVGTREGAEVGVAEGCVDGLADGNAVCG